MGASTLQSVRASERNLFGFVDATDTLGINTNINWSHRFSQHLFVLCRLSLQPAQNADRALL